MENGIRSLGAISDLAARHGKNCDALAKDLATHAVRAAPQITAFKKLLATNQQALAARYGERMQQVGKAAVRSLRDHCAKHPAITSLLKQLE